MGKPGPKAHSIINDLLKNARGKSPVENNANYIIALNDERAREFESPTILTRTWS